MPYFDNLILRRRSIIPISSSRKRGREGGAPGQGCRTKSQKAACVCKKDRADAGDDRHGRNRRRSLRRAGARLPRRKPQKAACVCKKDRADAGDDRHGRSRRRSLRRGGARLPREKPQKAAGCALAEDVDAGDSRYWRSSGNTCGTVRKTGWRHADAFAKRRRPKLKQEGRRRAWYAWYT